jgi:4-amino-4-deoxy-L-arabinose transferase-like glycosyltransferase
MNSEADRTPRWFLAALAGITLVAFGVRVAYVLIARNDFEPGGDAFFYHAGANILADGGGFVQPFRYPLLHQPAAEHPPLYLIFLSIPSVLGMESTLTHMLWSCVVGAGTVILVGFVGKEVAGPRSGIVAAVIATLYPSMWAPDGALQAETLAMFLGTLAVLLAYRYWRDPSAAKLIWLGAACGAGALTRSELILLVPLIALPLALLTRTRPMKGRVLWLGGSVLAAVSVIAPWSIYNVTRFEHPVWLSAQAGPLLSAANCDSTYYGSFQAYFDIECTIAIDEREGFGPETDQSVIDKAHREEAFEYIRDNLDRLPTVERARLLRILGLYFPSRYVHQEAFTEGRELWVVWSGLWSFWGLSLLAIAGAVVLARRKNSPPLYPLLAPIATVFITVLLTYANTRFRAIAEPMLAILAAIAIDAVIRAVRSSGLRRREEVVAVPRSDGHDRPLRVDAGGVGNE